MPLRLTRATLLALALLLSQTSCGGPVAHVETAARVLPLVLPKEPKPKPKPRPVVAVTDSAIVVKHGNQVRVIRRDDDDGDGEPDEDY